MRHLRARPAISASHVPGEHLAITVHGRADVFDPLDPRWPDLRQAMLDHYLPRVGEGFREWVDSGESLGARIEPERIFTFSMPSPDPSEV